MCLFLTDLALIRTQKPKENFADNKFYNTLKVFHVLPNFPLTTSKNVCDCYL